MPKPIGLDHQNTRQYIPQLSNYYPEPIKEAFENFESRYFQEGRRVFADYTDMNYLNSMFQLINLDCIYRVDDQIIPQFVLEFYSLLNLTTNFDGEIYVNFTIRNQMISYSLPAFGQALGVPTEGQCTFTHEWSLDALARSSPSYGKYATIPRSPEEIRSIVQNDRYQPKYRVHQGALIPVSDNQILTKEIVDHMKPMTEIIRENVFCL